MIHQRLLDRGYAATSGNSYARPVPDLTVAGGPNRELAVDLLVPSPDGRFRSQEYGGRAFDSAPGLAPALAADPIMIETRARLLDGTYVDFTVPVPTVEQALVIKAGRRHPDERSFQMSKHDLQARPIYHRLRDSIDAHLPIVFPRGQSAAGSKSAPADRSASSSAPPAATAPSKSRPAPTRSRPPTHYPMTSATSSTESTNRRGAH